MKTGSGGSPGWLLFGLEDARIGTVLAIQCEPGSDSPAWLLVRLSGLRRRLRAVPAGAATWLPPGRLVVRYSAEQVMASPPAPDERALQDDDWRDRAASFYRQSERVAS